MSILLSDLVEQLQADIPAQGGVPGAEQYESAVLTAVVDFGNRAGRLKRASLNIISGTAVYDLPADFLKMVKLFSLTALNGIINTPSGLIPVSDAFQEEYFIAGGQINFYPTPAYNLAREYRYKAGFALTGTGASRAYADMTQVEADIVMLSAQARATKKIENAAGGGVSYRQGDVSVDTTGAAAALRASSDRLNTDYLAAVDAYIGTVLVME